MQDISINNLQAIHVRTVLASKEKSAAVLALGLILFLIQFLVPRKRDIKQRNGPTETTGAASSSSDSHKRYPGGHVTVYYGSQTGTAESFARDLEREGSDHGFMVTVEGLEGTTPEDLLKKPRTISSEKACALFLVSTCGEGEAPDNAAEFVKSLREKLDDGSSSSLQGLDYAVFGLGNKQYDHFNAMGKFFDDALGRQGGHRLAEAGLGNDDADLEGDFENWKDNLVWPALEKKYLSSASEKKGERSLCVTGDVQDNPAAYYAVEYHENSTCVVPENKLSLEKVRNTSRPYFTASECPVTVIRELRTGEDEGSTIHVEIDVSKAEGFSYETADNLGVLPINDSSAVESVARSLGYDLDTVFSVKAVLADSHEWQGAPFPTPISIRQCLTSYCDLTAAPRRPDLKIMSAYAKDPVEKETLLRMASKDGKDEYSDKILSDFVGMSRLLETFPSIEMPLNHFLSVCPLLQPRFYTISSSSSVHPDAVHLTVTVDKADRVDGSVFKGVCSNTIANSKHEATQLRIFNRPSTFRLPKDSSKPIIMVGPGTGIAPMRALLQERSHQRMQEREQVGENILYFGCKNASQDYLYQDELKRFQESGDLNQLHVAFSRQKKEKVYVQDLLAENAEGTWKLINDKGAHVYVCGAVRMGSDISVVLKEICVSQGGMTPDAAESYLATMAKDGRYVQELWA